MDILKILENKWMVYGCSLVYFISLCIMSQIDSAFVGFGFVFLWIMSIFTQNIVFCLTGSLALTSMIFVQYPYEEGFSFDERCNSTCYVQNRDISTQYDDIKKENDSLKKVNTTLQNEITDLTAAKDKCNQTLYDVSVLSKTT